MSNQRGQLITGDFYHLSFRAVGDSVIFKDEKDYLIRKKEISKDLKNSLLVQLVCEEKGHLLEEGRVINGSYFQGYCKRCRMAYQGGLTQKERNSSDRLMHTPMTI